MAVDTVFHSADGKNTQWNIFKNNVKSDWNYFKVRVKNSDFYKEWAKPAAHDAVSFAKDIFDKEVNKPSNKTDSNSKKSLKEVANDVFDVFDPAGSGTTGSSYSSVRPAVNSGSVAAAPVNYLNADLARHYGMDARAAYSEALQNTAYQRAVADLKRAGLNPVLAVNGMSPAGSYVAGNQIAVGNTLSGGSGSGSSGGYRSGNSGKYAFSADEYNLIGITGQVVGALVGMTLSPKAPVLGMSTGMMAGKQLAQSYAQAVSSASRRGK